MHGSTADLCGNDDHRAQTRKEGKLMEMRSQAPAAWGGKRTPGERG